MNITKITKKIFSHDLIKGSAYVFTGGMLASVVNFLFNILITRKVSYVDYGIYAAVISLIGLLSIPAQAIAPIIIKYATLFFTHKEYGQARDFFVKSLFSLTILGVLLTIILLIFSTFVSNFFQLGNWLYIFATGVMVTLVYIALLTSTYLQSELRFGLTSLLNFLGSVGKIVVGFGLVITGFGVVGGLVGVAVASIIPIVVGLVVIYRSFKRADSKKVNLPLREFFTFSVSSFISMLAVTSFASSDILLVKHFFTPHEAGLYAGLSLVGKIIFYFTSPIIAVMLPVLMHKFHKEEKINSILYLSIILVFVPSMILSFLYFLFPSFFITFFLGGRSYLAMTTYVGWYGLYIAFFSGCNVLVSYFLTLHNLKASYITGISALLQIVGILFFHANVIQVVFVSLGAIIFLSTGLVILFFSHIHAHDK